MTRSSLNTSAFESTKRLVDPNFAGYSFDLVFRYDYVGAELWQHGGVKVRNATACSPPHAPAITEGKRSGSCLPR